RGLVNPLGFLLVNMVGDRYPPWIFGVGLAVYDLIAIKWGHKHYDHDGMLSLCPQLRGAKTLGGYRYIDAETDDARLVLRVLREAVRDGGVALSHARVEHLLQLNNGQVCGVALRDGDPEGNRRQIEVQAPVVISATGAWADDLRTKIGARARLRPLQGSHLVLSAERLPLTRSVSIFHPKDHRPVFAFPWQGVIVVGTTDVDCDGPLGRNPRITPYEVEYLMAFLQKAFPSLDLTLSDVQCTFSGVRSVVDTGKTDPSKESREHVLWRENGLLTVTGGKLTTFRLMAQAALRVVRKRLPGHPRLHARQRVLDSTQRPPAPAVVDPSMMLRLVGRYGSDAYGLLSSAQDHELKTIPGSQSMWAELRWAARNEGIIHLDDLLLRRLRLGLQQPEGGVTDTDSIRRIVQEELGWSDDRWDQELEAYKHLWQRAFSPP
ncbi:MAG: FAD-dependent oxidoreductase, partial [Anaerolineales bacterium]